MSICVGFIVYCSTRLSPSTCAVGSLFPLALRGGLGEHLLVTRLGMMYVLSYTQVSMAKGYLCGGHRWGGLRSALQNTKHREVVSKLFLMQWSEDMVSLCCWDTN